MIIKRNERHVILNKTMEFEKRGWNGVKKAFPVPDMVFYLDPTNGNINYSQPSLGSDYGICTYFAYGSYASSPRDTYLGADRLLPHVTYENGRQSSTYLTKVWEQPTLGGVDDPWLMIALDCNHASKVRGPLYETFDPVIKRETIDLYNRSDASSRTKIGTVASLAFNFATPTPQRLYYNQMFIVGCKGCTPAGMLNMFGERDAGAIKCIIRTFSGRKPTYGNTCKKIGEANGYDLWLLGNTVDYSYVDTSSVGGGVARGLFGLNRPSTGNFEFIVLYNETQLSYELPRLR